MPDPAGLLHPRRLVTMLRACPAGATRARAALEFLRGSSGAEAGFLLEPRGETLVVTAATAGETAPAELIAEAARAFAEAIACGADDDRTRDLREVKRGGGTNGANGAATTRTASFTAENGARFERRLLIANRRGWLAAGVVMLRVAPERELAPIRHEHIEAICEALLEQAHSADR